LLAAKLRLLTSEFSPWPISQDFVIYTGISDSRAIELQSAVIIVMFWRKKNAWLNQALIRKKCVCFAGRLVTCEIHALKGGSNNIEKQFH